LVLTAAGLFFFLFGSWVLSLTSPDEGRNAYAALHMLKSGDWIAPYYNCQPRFEKPPLLYWLMALSFKLFGADAFAARLPSGLAALFTSFVVYLLIFDPAKALTAALFFMLIVHNWIESRAATPEMLLTFFSTLGLYLLLTGRVVWGYAALGLAFLTKGPVGVALPLAVYLLWHATEGLRGFLKAFKNLLNPAGILLFLAVGSSWYAAMLYKFGWDYFYAFFVEQNLNRFLGKLGEHRYPFWYYLPVLAVAILPFWGLVPRVLLRFEKKFLAPALWFLFVFIFYSISKEKLHHYLLFAYPPLAVIFAHYAGQRYARFALAFGAAGILALTGAAYLYEKERFTPKAVELLRAKNPDRLFFYKDENSALVFYLYRCIPYAKRGDLKVGDFVVTKEKHARELKPASVLVEGREFDKGKELLLRLE